MHDSVDNSGRALHDCLQRNGGAIVVKEPDNCSTAEIDDFAAFVLAGGEVSPENLIKRVKAAEKLVFLSQSACLKGVAAIKNPGLKYKNAIFRKAQTSLHSKKFSFELGWVFLHPSARGFGLSHKLVEGALSATGGLSVFATSRLDNEPMHKTLVAHGFFRHGKPFLSSRGNYKLILFICGVQ